MKDNNKNKTNVPNLRFPGFEEEWERKRLGEVADKVMYGMNAAAIPFDGINKYLRITDIDDISRRFKANPLTSPSGEIEEKYQLKVGDIVLTRTGASVGKSYLYNPNDGKLLFAGFLIKFSIINANPYFVFSQTLKSNYNKWVQKMSMRSGQPGINAEEYKDLELAFPAISEQDKISTFLSLIDERIQCQNKIIEELKSFKSEVSRKTFSQEFRFKDENGEDFAEWEEKRLGEVADVNMGQSPDSKSYNTDGIGMPLIQGNADIQNRKSNPRNWTSDPTKKCQVGDLILTVRAPVGAIAKSSHNACIGRGVCSIRNNSISNIEFLYQFLLDYELKWIRLEQGSTFTAVSGTDIRTIETPTPSLPEQTKIANFLSAIDEKITNVELRITKMEGWKKGLLQQMFV